jgi:hypothetical protein
MTKKQQEIAQIQETPKLTTFLVNPQVLQAVANYLVERPFKEVSDILAALQSCTAIQDDGVKAVIAIANKEIDLDLLSAIVEKNYKKAIDILSPLSIAEVL